MGQERDGKINECELILENYQHDVSHFLETIGSIDHVKQQIDEIDEVVKKTSDKIRTLTESRAKFNYQIENIINPSVLSIDNKINAMNSVADAKLNYLQQHQPDTYTAIMWLRKNQKMFRGRIYEPLIMEINVRSNEYCKYIENCVKFQDMLAFTCEESEDMTKFLKLMRVDEKLKVNAVHSAAANQLRYKSTVPISEVRKFGGEIYLIDCLEAPFPIMNYLCQAYNMQNVLIGNENLERKANLLPANLQLFFTQTHSVVVKSSKYSNQKSLMSSEIRSKNLLNVQVSKKDLDEYQEQKRKLVQNRDQLRNKRTEIETTINQLEEQCKTHFQEKAELNRRVLELENLRKRVKMQEQKLKRLQDEPFDLEGETKKFKERVKDIVTKMNKFNENSITVYDQMLAIELNEDKARARLVIFKNGTANFETQLMECKDEIDRITGYCDRIGNILDKTKQETEEKQLIALKLTDNHKPTEGDNFPYKKDFDELSDDRKELQDEMEDLECQISCRPSSDHSVLDEYKERVKNIEALKKDLKNDRSSAEVQREIDTLHIKWFPQITSIVKSINRHFGRFMQTMSCAGEVDLVFPSDRDYDKYGIEIRVKYRTSEKLRALDRFVQSGGERAVAIAVYSLSLQHLSQVPFRCVDEINQGMDPNNERRVFNMLVKSVAQPGQSQFFYVTPKLQELLPYNEHVTCLTVFNGPFTNYNDFFEEV